MSLVGIYPRVLSGTFDGSMLLYYIVFEVVVLYCVFCFTSSMFVTLAFSHISSLAPARRPCYCIVLYCFFVVVLYCVFVLLLSGL